MTRLNPFLFIKRLVVISSTGVTMYDEEFHAGVNIIRGDNSVGKSSIAGFLFFGLGGDFQNWTDAALYAKSVFLEMDINGTVLTSKRELHQSARPGMSIFYGEYASSIKHAAEGWSYFSYNSSESKLSFSNVLFELLNFPEIKGDFDNTITIHQILRLIYISQKSLTESFFLTEQFDSQITRKTVFELLIGTYDDELYEERINLRDNEKQLDTSKRQLKAIERLFINSEYRLNKVDLEKAIEQNRERLLAITESISKERNQKLAEASKIVDNTKLLESLQGIYLKERNHYSQINSEIKELFLDISDSELFIKTLRSRIRSLEESNLTANVLSGFNMTHCPSCLSEIEKNEVEGNCSLCKKPLERDGLLSSRGRMKQELLFQIRESDTILARKRKDLNEKKALFARKKQQVTEAKIRLDDELKLVQTTRDEKLDLLLTERGRVETQIEYQIKQIKVIEQYEIVKKEVIYLKNFVENLRSSIADKEQRQDRRRQSALREVENISSWLLKNDLGYQREFKNPEEIGIDLAKNTYSLNGKNNFSESSNIYLKNSVRFALFFASLRKKYFRFPRLIICDNIEDKGMQKERSSNFQKLLVKLSESIDVEHQIIFTTSMVADDLNTSKYGIGEYYTPTNKVLKLENSPNNG